jgi:hypothetical protein
VKKLFLDVEQAYLPVEGEHDGEDDTDHGLNWLCLQWPC